MEVNELLEKTKVGPIRLELSPILRFQEAVMKRVEELLEEYSPAHLLGHHVGVTMPVTRGSRSIVFTHSHSRLDDNNVTLHSTSSVDLKYMFQWHEDQNFSQFSLTYHTFCVGRKNEQERVEHQYSFYTRNQGPEETGKMAAGLILEYLLLGRRSSHADVHVRVHEIAYEQGWRQNDQGATIIDATKPLEGVPENIKAMAPDIGELERMMASSAYENLNKT